MYPMFPVVRSQISVLFKEQVPCPKSVGKFLKPSFSSSGGGVSSYFPLTALSESVFTLGFSCLLREPLNYVLVSPITQICAAEQSRVDEQVQQAFFSLSHGHVCSCTCVCRCMATDAVLTAALLQRMDTGSEVSSSGPGSPGAGLIHWQTFGSSAAWRVAGRTAFCLNCFNSLSSYFIKVSLH